MVIMIIFLVLSMLFLIGTVIYVNYKKKNINKAIKLDSNAENKQKKNRNNKNQLADILEVKIKDNIICLGNRYSIVVRLGNIDYNMMSDKEQETVEYILSKTALSIDYPIQFYSTTEYIDTSKIIDLISKNQMNNDKIKEYQEYLIKYLYNLMENRSITVIRNYAIISYDGLYDNAKEELIRQAMSFKGSLQETNIICEVLNEDELYDLVYRELNKNSLLSIRNLNKGGNSLYVSKKEANKRNRYI